MTNKAAQSLTTDADVLEDLDDIEHMAVELATLAGAEIVTTYGGIFTVRYKTGAAGALSSLRDPVSEIDRRVETLIRARLAEGFPFCPTSENSLDSYPLRDLYSLRGGEQAADHVSLA